MDRIHYLGPFRQYPRREYTWSGATPLDVGRFGERTVDAVLAADANNEMRNRRWKAHRRPFSEFLAGWLDDLGLVHQFRVQEIAEGSNLYRVYVQQRPGAAEVVLTDVGFGVSQFLPVLVLLYYVPERSIVLVEQPEIHLHPAVQSGLADVLINATQRRRIQVVVETHSEHLLRRLQRRVAEEEIRRDEMMAFYCEFKRGKSELVRVGVDLYGNIVNWPEGFFGDTFGEIAAIQEAGLQRRLAAVE